MFDEAFKNLIEYEGGYANDPDDAGGETYKGISRHYHPEWRGWQVVDDLRNSPRFPEMLDDLYTLNEAVKIFYKSEFWNKVKGDVIPDSLADELFEQAVNMHVQTAVEHLQITLNLLNRNEELYKNIEEDGIFGNATLSTLKVSLTENDESLIYNILNILQGCKYIRLMQQNEVKEKYVGWFKRVEIRKRHAA